MVLWSSNRLELRRGSFTGVLRKLFIWASLCTTAVYFRGPPADALPSRDMWAGGLGPEAQYVCAAPIPWSVQRAVRIRIPLLWNVSFAAPPWLDAAVAVAAQIAPQIATWTPEKAARLFAEAAKVWGGSQPFCVGAAARPLVDLLRFGDAPTKTEAARELAKLANTSMACRSVVIEAGAVEALVALVDTSHPDRHALATGQARVAWYHIRKSLAEAAVHALGTLAAGDGQSYAAVVEGIEPVVARLEGGDYESRGVALTTLHHMRRSAYVGGRVSGEPVVSADLLVEAGVAAPLVKLLRCNAGLRKFAFWQSERNTYKCDWQQMEAADLIADLGWSSIHKGLRDLAAAGAVPALFEMLDGRPLLRGSKMSRDLRVGSGLDALFPLSLDEGARNFIVGKINRLVKLLRDKSYEDGRLYNAVAGILWYAAGPKTIDTIIRSEAVPALMALMPTHRESISFHTSRLLLDLASGGSDDNKDAIISAGAVPMLVEGSKDEINGAHSVLARLSEGSDVRRDIIESAGYVPVAAKATDAPGRDPDPRWKTWLRTVGLLVAFPVAFELIHDVTFVVGPVIGTPFPRLKIWLWLCPRILMQSIPAVFSLLSRSSFLPVLAGVFLCGTPGILCARPTALALLYVYGALGYMMLTGALAFVSIVFNCMSVVCVFPLSCSFTLASNVAEALRGSQRGFFAGLKADLALQLWQYKNMFDFHSMYEIAVGMWERRFHIRVPRWSIWWSSLLLPSFVAPYVVLLTWSFGFLPRLRWASFVADAAFFFWLFVSPLKDAATRTHVSVSVVGAFRPIFHEVRETLRLVFLRKSPRVQPDPGDACIVCHEEFGKEIPGDFDDATQLAWCDWGCGRLNAHEECMREVLKRKQKAACLVCAASWRPLSIETKSDRKKQKYETQWKFFMYCLMLLLGFALDKDDIVWQHARHFVDGTGNLSSVRVLLRVLTTNALIIRMIMPEMPPLFGPPP